MPNTGSTATHPPFITLDGGTKTMPKRFDKPRRLYDCPTVQQSC